jgi:hypothetical protein
MAPKKISNRKDKKLEGKYANYFAVGYNAHEFIFDFGQNYSENDPAELFARIITIPASAKAFFETFRKSISQYEQSYGIIAEDDQS